MGAFRCALRTSRPQNGVRTTSSTGGVPEKGTRLALPEAPFWDVDDDGKQTEQHPGANDDDERANTFFFFLIPNSPLSSFHPSTNRVTLAEAATWARSPSKWDGNQERERERQRESNQLTGESNQREHRFSMRGKKNSAAMTLIFFFLVVSRSCSPFSAMAIAPLPPPNCSWTHTMLFYAN